MATRRSCFASAGYALFRPSLTFVTAILAAAGPSTRLIGGSQPKALPMVVRVSYRGRGRHDVRVKVQITHGAGVNSSNMAVVAVRPVPRLIAGHLSQADQQLIFEWITLNVDVLVAYWDGQTDSVTLIQDLRRLPSPGQPASPSP